MCAHEMSKLSHSQALVLANRVHSLEEFVKPHAAPVCGTKNKKEGQQQCELYS